MERMGLEAKLQNAGQFWPPLPERNKDNPLIAVITPVERDQIEGSASILKKIAGTFCAGFL